jgi:uncharacterized protein (DUF2252 family)
MCARLPLRREPQTRHVRRCWPQANVTCALRSRPRVLCQVGQLQANATPSSRHHERYRCSPAVPLFPAAVMGAVRVRH